MDGFTQQRAEAMTSQSFTTKKQTQQFGSRSQAADLKPKILATMQDRHVRCDGKAVFSCDFSSADQSKTQINWYHNSILITKSENQQKYVIKNDNNRSILFILNVNHEDSGNYEIRIINKHGFVSQSANLHVGNGKPPFV